MMRLGAAWVVPIDHPPIRDGWVAVEDGRILSVGQGNGRDAQALGPLRRLGEVALLPGLVNAHTHLELSWLRNRVPPANVFTSWVKQLMVARGGRVERIDDPAVTAAATQAAREALETGTAAVGDISNSLASVRVIADAGLRGLVFHELLGFKETSGALIERTAASRTDAVAAGDGRVRVSIAPHAPYSVSPELFRAVRDAVSASAVQRTSIHVGESPEETELLASGTGEWATMLRWIGAWRDDWVPPGTGPVEYLDSLGTLDAGTLVVHGVQLSDDSLARVRSRGATLVTCPRSNQWVGVGVPPIERFYRSGVAIAVGTDSLASVADLNLFEEMKAMHWLAPAVPAARLLESATLVGARALGLGDELGSLTAGKRAEIVQVEVPPGLDDVEEYLVSGVPASAIGWAAHTREGRNQETGGKR
jgi:cytosine/adenosine deaminase-related metal-dependent hydrolase